MQDANSKTGRRANIRSRRTYGLTGAILLLLLGFTVCKKSPEETSGSTTESQPAVAEVDPNVITIAADEWCPYNCVAGSSKPGYMVEIARAVFVADGKQVRYETLNWARAIAMARDGKYDGIIGAYKSEAPEFIYPAEDFGPAGNTFYTKQDSVWKYAGVKSLAPVSVGFIRDYSYGDDLDAYIKQNERNSKLVQIVSGDEAVELNIKKLLAGRVTTIVEDRNVMSYHLKTRNTPDALRVAGNAGEEPVYIAFAPGGKHSAQYARTLGDGIVRLRRSGKLKQILDRYGIRDWK